jgi:hypothetical protein
MDAETLDDLDPPAWADANDNDTYLVRRCHELRRKPLSEFAPEDLRIMIGQQIALPYLVPRALNLLAADPLVSGDLFPGDLLEAVMRIDGSYWDTQPDQRARVIALTDSLVPVDGEVRAAIESFRSQHA